MSSDHLGARSFISSQFFRLEPTLGQPRRIRSRPFCVLFRLDPPGGAGSQSFSVYIASVNPSPFPSCLDDERSLRRNVSVNQQVGPRRLAPRALAFFSRVPVPTCPDALRDSPLLFPVSDTNNTNPRSEFDAGLAKAAILSPRTPCVGTARAAVAAAFNHRQGAWTQLDLPGLIAQDGDRIAPSKASYRALGQLTSIPCVLPDPTLPLDSGSDPPSCVFSAQPLITLRYVTVFSLPGDNV